MEWWLALAVILGSLIVLMLLGLPVAFCFMLVNIAGVLVWWGGVAGLHQFISSIFWSMATFSLVPVPLFILMGQLLFESGVAPDMIDALDHWLRRLPGRLGLEAVGAGTLIATLSGSSMASVGMLGSALVPEMEKRGYGKAMSLGPILGSAGLAIMIPPSAAAIILGFLGGISIGNLLIAIIIPGVLMAVLYSTYIIGRCALQPHLAPAYTVPPTTILKKLVDTARYILPVGIVIFLVTGVIFLGIATPSEAAATGALGTFLLVALLRKLNWTVVKKSVRGTVAISVMAFMILVGAQAFSQILAFSGATRGVVELVSNVNASPLIILIIIQSMLIFLGMFMGTWAIMMITVPIFMPIASTLGFDPVWFGVIFLLNMEMGSTTPPFGMTLFVMKGTAPSDTTMGDLYRSALPFLGCDVIAMALIVGFPVVALWLPGLMR